MHCKFFIETYFKSFVEIIYGNIDVVVRVIFQTVNHCINWKRRGTVGILQWKTLPLLSKLYLNVDVKQTLNHKHSIVDRQFLLNRVPIATGRNSRCPTFKSNVELYTFSL